MTPITCIEDLRQLAERRVPRAFFQYVDSGSYAEETFRANRTDMERIKLRQRVLVNVDKRDLSTTIVGQKASLPIALAPIGLCGMQHGNGEILAAQAANEAGIPFCMSTMSICSMEQVAEATKKPFWFQVYVIRDRGFIADLIARAKAANCSALVLTVDLQVLGQRHRDIKNGMTVPPKIKLANVHRHHVASRAGREHAECQEQDLRQSRRSREGHGGRQFARAMDRTASSIRR